jgi:hypothetical protein
LAISSDTRKAGPFLGNDATTVFPFTFKVFAEADLLVVHTDAFGLESDLVLTQDYTVSLNADQDVDPGGSVTLPEALPEDERLTITSDVAALQSLVLTNNGGFYPRVINDAFDRITIIAQQIKEQVGRSLKLPISSTASPTLPDPTPNAIIAWNSDASGFVNIAPGSLATVAAFANARAEVFEGDGVETEFVLEFDPGTLANLDISVGGVTQTPGVDFTFVGSVVLFTSPPPNGVTVQIRYTNVLEVAPELEDAYAAVTAAQLAETNAETAQAGAEAAQAQTLIYRDATEAFRDETAIYAGASNISNYYANTAAGLAATASGSYFGVITTSSDGVLVYLDNAGSAVLQQTMPSINWVAKHQQIVPCEVVGGTKRAPIIRPINTWTVLTGDAATGSATLPHYVFTYKATETNDEAGSYNVTIQNGDGSAFLAATALTDANLAAPAPGAIQAGKLVELFRRDAGAGSALEWITRPDATTAPQAETMISMGLKTPKPNRPVHALQVGDNLALIRVKLHEDHYTDITYANHSDHLKIGYMNVGPFMSLDDDFLALNSMWGHMKNKDIEFGNFVYDALDSGTTVETGLVWSAFEAVIIIGDMADAADTVNLGSNFQLAGRAHGHVVDPPTTSRVGYRKDTANGTPTAATKSNPLTVTANGSQAKVGERVRFSGVLGMTQLNDTWLTVTGSAGNPTVLTFAGVDSTSWGTFSNTSSTPADPVEREQTDLADPAINNEWAGIRLIQHANGELTVPDGTVACSFTDSTTFEQHEDYQILFEWELDFNDAVGITPGTRSGGYALMCPTSGVNRAVGYVNGVQGTVKIIDKRDGTNTLFGYAEKIVLWNADDPEVQLVVENIAGAGYTHFEDGVGVAYAAEVFGANNDYGTKIYWPVYPVSAPVSLAGKVLTGGARYKLVRGTPIT